MQILLISKYTNICLYVYILIHGVQTEHISPVLEDLHWLRVSQREVFKTALMVWKCVHGVAPAYLSDLCVPATAISGRQHRRSAATDTLLFHPPRLQLDNEVSQSTDQPPPHGTVCHQHYGHRTCHRAPSSGHWRRRPAPLRHLHDSGADCKYPDLLTYLHTGDTISNRSN